MSPIEYPEPPSGPAEPLRWDLFCRVIDNHGDLGVCWRFATDLAGRGQQVRLWVDDASALAWMAPRSCTGVHVRAWAEADGDDGDAADAEPGDVVVEAFGCDPPAGFVARMAARAQAVGGAPVWINLEYLSAEAYVERSHGLASPQFSGLGQGLTKWFWYPGFTPRTGGLLREPGLLDRTAAVDREVSRAALLRRFESALAAADDSAHRGADAAADAGPPANTEANRLGAIQARLALLFCYDNPALPVWLDAMSQAEHPWCVLVTPGTAAQAVARWWRTLSTQQGGQRLPSWDEPVAATRALRLGSLSLLPLAPVDQQQFDHLLWACDFNFVRGEDSFVRAHWAGRPFIWQAYVQDDGAQYAKIDAWLKTYAGAAPEPLRHTLTAAHQAWNSRSDVAPGEFDAVVHDVLGRHGTGESLLWPSWCAWADRRRNELSGQDDLVTQLLGFVAEKRGARHPR